MKKLLVLAISVVMLAVAMTAYAVPSGKTLEFDPKGSGKVIFSGKVHADAKLKCADCHASGLFKMKKGADAITMQAINEGKFCGHCHNGKRAFAVTDNCGACHRGMKPAEVAFTTKGISNAVFSHKLHLDMDYKCGTCHTAIFPYKAVSGKYTMGDMEKGKSCGTCHNGKDAFSSNGDCEKCHQKFKPGVITFKTDGGDVTFSHDFHLGMYKCPDCHTKIFPFKAGVQHIGMGGMEQGKSCGTCHNGKDAFSTKGDCEKCHKM